MTVPRPLALALSLAISVTATARADTLTFQQGDGGAYSSTAATTINLETSFNFGSAIVLTVSTYYVQALIRFPDIIGSNAGQIPPGSTITSALLSVTMYSVHTDGGDSYVHMLYTPWDENTVHGQGFYAQAGPLWGPEIAMFLANDPYMVTSASVTSVVQNWADGDHNWGFMLRLETPPTPEQGSNTSQYFSDDAADPSWRPKLTVNFTPPPIAVEPTTWGKVKSLYR